MNTNETNKHDPNTKNPQTVSVETMRRSDAYTIANLVSSKELMRRAGQGIYDAVCEACGGTWREPVAIVCGKGNNAGDGYVVANLLHEAGIECEIILLDANRFSDDGKHYFNLCQAKGIPTKTYSGDLEFTKYATILDALLGTGFNGNVIGATASVIEAINRAGERGVYVVSADINSGLNGDTGLCGKTLAQSAIDSNSINPNQTSTVSNPDLNTAETCIYVKSDLTVSIGTFKHGHFRGLADEAMKSKTNCDIGIPIIEP